MSFLYSISHILYPTCDIIYDMNIPDVKRNVALAPYTTYGIGGPADYYVEAISQDQLAKIVIDARQSALPYFILGRGANILVADQGFRGLVIRNMAQHVAMQDGLLIVESGAVISDLIALTAEQGWSGLEHFAGIPSTVGGAMWQNLHFLSPDRSRTVFISEIVESAKVLMPDSSIQQVGAEFFEFGYDDSLLHHQEVVVLEVGLRLNPGLKSEVLQQIDKNLLWRRHRQPQVEDCPSCGSVFKQIEGVGAGRLIDEAGLKGKRSGGAQISELHANFIINTGGATARDVLDLAALAQGEVQRKLGYDLEMEINLVGEF